MTEPVVSAQYRRDVCVAQTKYTLKRHLTCEGRSDLSLDTEGTEHDVPGLCIKCACVPEKICAMLYAVLASTGKPDRLYPNSKRRWNGDSGLQASVDKASGTACGAGDHDTVANIASKESAVSGRNVVIAFSYWLCTILPKLTPKSC